MNEQMHASSWPHHDRCSDTNQRRGWQLGRPSRKEHTGVPGASVWAGGSTRECRQLTKGIVVHCSSQRVVMHHSILAKIHVGKGSWRVWHCQLQATCGQQALRLRMHTHSACKELGNVRKTCAYKQRRSKHSRAMAGFWQQSYHHVHD